MAAPSLFDFLKHLTEPNGRRDLLLESEENMKAYQPFIINRGLAQHIATVMYAQEMNKCPGIGKEMHYGFLFSAIKKSKRYSKWAKKDEIPEDIQLIAETYQISIERAMEYAKLISKEDIQRIRQKQDKGGIMGKPKGV